MINHFKQLHNAQQKIFNVIYIILQQTEKTPHANIFAIICVTGFTAHEICMANWHRDRKFDAPFDLDGLRLWPAIRIESAVNPAV